MNEINRDTNTEINLLLHSAFRPETLKELFDRKLRQLDIGPTAALKILDISYRTLKGILEGTQTSFDITNLIKLASLLQESREHVIKLYLDAADKVRPINLTITPEKVAFIKQNFDLAILKKDGFINDLTDFAAIERRITHRLGLKTIFEYQPPSADVAFSSGNFFQPKNQLTRSFWIAAAKACFEEIDNPCEFDRQKVMDFFPKIRWHSTDVEHGLLNVIRTMYTFGVTIIYQPALHTLQLRGATFSVDGKPCIVLTNYMGFYSTLWFAMVHEMLHVIFDWDEIRTGSYHLSDDANSDLKIKEKEAETNKYAREYLFSLEKTDQVRRFIHNPSYVKEYALNHHVHPSLVYAFHAFDAGGTDKMAWARARKYDGNIKACIAPLDIPWESEANVGAIVKEKLEIYN